MRVKNKRVIGERIWIGVEVMDEWILGG